MRHNKRNLALIILALLFCSCTLVTNLISTAQSEFDQGVVLFNSGKYQEAVVKFLKATEMDPNFGRAYLYLGRSYINLKNWRQALDPLRTAYRLIPEDTKGEVVSILIDALFTVGLDAFKAGDFLSAIGSLKEILGLQPTSAKARSELVNVLVGYGSSLLSGGNVTQAIGQYTEAVKLMPTSFDALFGLARAFFRNGEYFKALQTAEEAVRFNPSHQDLQSLLQELRRK
jgi:tetratricopeptide (TPR) repeat protein